MIAIDDFIDKLEIDDPVIFGNIAFSRVYGDNLFKEKVEFVEDAIKTGMFRVGETGNVPEITVQNGLLRKVFLPCGVIVEGGKQNRSVRYPTLVQERTAPDPTKTRIAVRCCQQGRWHYDDQPRPNNTDFVTQTTIMKANARSGHVDQHRTWHTVAMSTRAFHIDSDSEDYADIAKQIPIDEYKTAFRECQKRQLGHVVAIRNDKDVLFYSDLFGNHDFFNRYYDQLVHSVAVCAKEVPSYHIKVERKYMQDFLKELANSKIKKEESYDGFGQLYLSSSPVDGSLLHVDDRTPVQYALRKDYVSNQKDVMISPNHTLIMDGNEIRKRLREMNGDDS
jgi:hypothetical protein